MDGTGRSTIAVTKDIPKDMKLGCVLNFTPVTFTEEKIRIGRLDWTDEEAYRALRESNWRTHAFRFDARYNQILNVSLRRKTQPLGHVEEVDLNGHLLLAAQAVQQSILIWVADKLPVLRRNNKRLLFWGQADEALLLSKAVKKAGLKPISGLEVPVRYEIDCRVFYDHDDHPFLGLVIDIGTANVIDIPVSDLLGREVPVVNRYVCQRVDTEQPYLHRRLELLGRAVDIVGNKLLLDESIAIDQVEADEVLLEPRLENFEEVVKAFYPRQASYILQTLRSLRQPLASSKGKLDKITQTLIQLQKQNFTIANGIEVGFGDLVDNRSHLFPQQISTERPTLLFGAQGRNSGLYPDGGIRSWGPYMYMQHTRNTPLVVVVCEARHRGTVEKFVNMLCNGYPDDAWQSKGGNPFRGGLVGKFRLHKVRVEYEECENTASEEYRRRIRRLLERVPEMPDLALVQTSESFLQRHGDENPYFVAKAAFMAAGVPVQTVFVEKMQGGSELPYLLNNVALASYAKLGGTPWVISTTGTTTHELVIGIGSAEVTSGRLGHRDRYVGMTTVFQGDGRYLIWNQTREVTFDEYPAELLSTLRTAIRYVQCEHNWEDGDKVRLVCHVFKRLKNTEVDAIKTLVRELLDSHFEVSFAFLDVSLAHAFYLFTPQQPGTSYWRGGRKHFRGQGLPDRGFCLQLDRRRALLHLTGPNDVKTEDQGLPQPLLLELHPDSDFTDLVYLARQCYHFIYASWRTFSPAQEPVTIKYSRQIARLLGNLKTVTGWDSTVLSVGSLRDRCWFL